MTDESGTSKQLRRVFLREVMPLAEQWRRHHGEPLATGADERAASYYRRRQRRSMSRAEFEAGCAHSTSELSERLAQMWNQRGEHELAALGPRLASIAESVRVDDEDDQALSPFIYAMY